MGVARRVLRCKFLVSVRAAGNDYGDFRTDVNQVSLVLDFRFVVTGGNCDDG